MLVLTRRIGERVEIEVTEPGRVTVEVLGRSGAKIRLGITADGTAVIRRGEVADREGRTDNDRAA
jgi:sRNA-binding carbon storage regulator CsrA